MKSNPLSATADEATWLRGVVRWLAAAIAEAEDRNALKDELFGPAEEPAAVPLTLFVSENRARAVRDGLAKLAVKLRRRNTAGRPRRRFQSTRR